MGKRPYYLITHLVDCDGYTNYIDYIGVNAKAALERFKFIVQDIRTRYFLNEGIEPDRIYYGNHQTWDEILSLTTDCIDTPGKAYTVYMNDDNCCWINIRIYVIETGGFFNYPTNSRWDDGTGIWSDNRERELQYRAEHPNAKYQDILGLIAQLVEHKTENLGVAGSIPAQATIYGPDIV